MNPEASDFVSMAGTLVGSLEAVKSLGFGALANQAKLAGFSGGALAEAVELARIYQASTASGETPVTTAIRLAGSAIPDIVAFVACAVVTDAAIGVAATGAALVGPVAAGMVAVAGAALLTYGISQAATAVKSAAIRLLIGK